MDVRLPDGTVIQNVPDGFSKADLVAKLKANGHDVSGLEESSPSLAGRALGVAKNIGMGALKGASDIGATIIQPLDAIGATGMTNKDRRASLGRFFNENADPDSLAFKGGDLAAGVAGTAGAGGVIAKGVRALPIVSPTAAKLASSIESGGFRLGGAPAATTAEQAGNMALRVGGGAVNGAATAGLINPDEAGTGAVIGGAIPVVGKAAGEAGNYVRRAVSGKLDETSRRLMQSALKPTIAELRKGNVEPAIQTLLDNGINVTKEGVAKLREKIVALNDDISERIASSNARVNVDDVLNSLSGTRGRFLNQADPHSDLSAINSVAENFSNHPYLEKIEAQGEPLLDALRTATRGKEQALQAAGKLKTFAQQQENLSNGRSVRLSPDQPENQPFFNVGNSGKRALSPNAVPVPGYPRISSRYTHNAERVSEGESGAKEAMAAYAQRRADEQAAQEALAQWDKTRRTITVQQAQAIKQGTYAALKNKYGQIGSAETEAQKSLARGLKDKVAESVPEVAGLNAKESALINALNVTERRVFMEANKNPMGLASLASHPAGWAAFMADRSGLFKALAGRAAYGASKEVLNNKTSNRLANLITSRPALAAPEVAIAQSQ